MNGTLVFHNYQVPHPWYWLVAVASLVLVPTCLNLTIECRLISSMRRMNTAESSNIITQYAMGLRTLPVLSIPLWVEIWKQRWGLRSWIGVFGAIHLSILAVFACLGGGAITYEQGTLLYYITISVVAAYAIGMAQLVLIMYFSTRKIYLWLVATNEPRLHTKQLYKNYMYVRSRLFFVSFCLESCFVITAIVLEMHMVLVVRTQLILISVPMVITFFLEVKRFKALYNALAVIRPQLDNSTLGSSIGDAESNSEVYRRKARRIVQTTILLTGSLIIVRGSLLVVAISPYAITSEGALSWPVIVQWHGVATVMYLAQLTTHIVSTHRKLISVRRRLRGRTTNRGLKGTSKLSSVNPDASRLFG